VGDPYFTDGDRTVMFFGPRPNELEDVRLLPWSRSGGRGVEDGPVGEDSGAATAEESVP